MQVEKDALVDWVLREKLPAYLPFTDDNQEVIFNSGIKINVRTAGQQMQRHTHSCSQEQATLTRFARSRVASMRLAPALQLSCANLGLLVRSYRSGHQ